MGIHLVVLRLCTQESYLVVLGIPYRMPWDAIWEPWVGHMQAKHPIFCAIALVPANILLEANEPMLLNDLCYCNFLTSVELLTVLSLDVICLSFCVSKSYFLFYSPKT